MTIEFAAYLVVVLTAIALAAKPIEARTVPIIIPLALTVFLALSIMVRVSGLDMDLLNHRSHLRAPLKISTTELREPVVWWGMHLLHSVIRDVPATFVIFDVAVFATVVAAFQRMKLPAFAFIAVMAFFPFILGMQNIYRQWVATCLLLYVAAYADRSAVKALIAFALAVLTHNMAAVFAGLLVPLLPPRWRPAAWAGLLIAVPAMLYFGAGTKSAVATGLELRPLYVLVVALVGVAAIGAMRITRGKWPGWDAAPFVYHFYVVAWAAVLLSSASAERIGLSALLLLYPAVVRLPDVGRGWQIPVARIVIIIGGFVPMLIFGVRIFLFT
jgi:hypothetical protein